MWKTHITPSYTLFLGKVADWQSQKAQSWGSKRPNNFLSSRSSAGSVNLLHKSTQLRAMCKASDNNSPLQVGGSHNGNSCWCCQGSGDEPTNWQLGKGPCVQEFRELFYEDCQWWGVLSSLQGLSALLATHGAMVSNFLAFIWTDTTLLWCDSLVNPQQRTVCTFTANLNKLIPSFIVFQENCDKLLKIGLPSCEMRKLLVFGHLKVISPKERCPIRFNRHTILSNQSNLNHGVKSNFF